MRAGDLEVGHREAREPGLGLRARAGGALVADLAARAGARARVRRDRRRVVVRLHLHEDVRGVHAPRPRARAVGMEALDLRALHHRRVVGVRDHGAARVLLVRVADHREERLVARLSVDGPRRVEDLVAAVLGIRLREHHQLDVGGIATELREVLHEVVDLVGCQRQAERGIGLDQRRAAALGEVHARHRLRRGVVEECRRLLVARDHRLGHAVVDGALERRERALRERRGSRSPGRSRPRRARCARPSRACSCARCRWPWTTTATRCRNAGWRAASCRQARRARGFRR